MVVTFVTRAQPSQMGCASQAPYGWPQLIKQNTIPLCRTAYGILYDEQAKISPWVVYTLTPDHAIGCVPRVNSFTADQTVPVEARSQVADYAHSGYDLGHIGNAADMSWDATIQHESFILSNVAPQLPSLNRGIWKELETSVRVWTWQSKHPYTVYAGSIYNSDDKTIGQNKVIVPHAFYKIVIDDVTHLSYAWIFPHHEGLGTDLTVYQTTVGVVEKTTGIQFPVPDDKTVINHVMSVNYSAYLHAKTTQCH